MILLASQSPYKRQQLSALGLPVSFCSPDTDESALPGEHPRDTALRLAAAKAENPASANSTDWVIGSDQTAHLESETHLLRKPGSIEAAIEQLTYCSGQTVLFHSGIAVRPPGTRAARVAVETVRVRFRNLDKETISRYIRKEMPLDCVGAFKCEGLGISLFESIESRDPTALVGLPMIALCRLLRETGLTIP